MAIAPPKHFPPQDAKAAIPLTHQGHPGHPSKESVPGKSPLGMRRGMPRDGGTGRDQEPPRIECFAMPSTARIIAE